MTTNLYAAAISPDHVRSHVGAVITAVAATRGDAIAAFRATAKDRCAILDEESVSSVAGTRVSGALFADRLRGLIADVEAVAQFDRQLRPAVAALEAARKILDLFWVEERS